MGRGQTEFDLMMPDEEEQRQKEDAVDGHIKQMEKLQKQYLEENPNGTPAGFQEFVMKMKENKDDKIDRNNVEELLYAIQNAAHSEYHMAELMEHNLDKAHSLQKYILKFRDLRIKLMDKLAEIFPSVKKTWCTIKHLLLLHFHLMEMYEKTGDDDYLVYAHDVYLDIDELLVQDEYDNLVKCSRCDE